MNKLFLIVLFAIGFLMGHAQTKKALAFSFIAIGDMPYFVPEDYGRFDNVIRQINSENPDFTIHVGDIKASNMLCTDEYFMKMVNYFESFTRPLIYTPGDNEWTDCNKKEAGSYDPHERLQAIRNTFFKNGKSFGKQKLNLVSQASNPTFKKFVENNRWEYNGVQFATVHAVGTSNNKIQEDNSRLNEFEERDVANLTWLDEVFRKAKENNNLAIVLAMQADMFNSKKGPEGFDSLIQKITKLCIDFKKPVLLINGDSHRFIIDKPLVRERDLKINRARVVENFTRLQLFGEQDMHAVKITFNPDLRGLFQIEQLFVNGN